MNLGLNIKHTPKQQSTYNLKKLFNITNHETISL